MNRRSAVLTLLVLGGLTLLAAIPTWMTADGSSALSEDMRLAVAGTTAAPAVSAAAFVLVASALALGLVGRVARWIVLAVAAGSGITSALAAANVLMDPVPAMSAEAARETGVAELTSAVTLAVFPWLVVALGILTVAVVVITALSSGQWTVTARHERQATPDVADDDPAAMWDELTRSTESEDPTD